MILSPSNCNKPPHFIELYQRLLEGRKFSRILEIGVQRGDSLKMWAHAFPQAEIVGLDIETCSALFPLNVKLVLGNQHDTALLESLGRFDFIVDDGSHMTADQQASFETLFPALNAGGVYVIEDIEFNRQHEFQNSPLSTIDYFMLKLVPTVRGNSEFKSVTFADNLIVIEKN